MHTNDEQFFNGGCMYDDGGYEFDEFGDQDATDCANGDYNVWETEQVFRDNEGADGVRDCDDPDCDVCEHDNDADPLDDEYAYPEDLGWDGGRED